MYYGDGEWEDVTVPAGTGTSTFSFTHVFKNPFDSPATEYDALLLQKATVRETLEADMSSTIHG
jgi:hypothetical protein